jgi:hypothetical protein
MDRSTKVLLTLIASLLAALLARQGAAPAYAGPPAQGAAAVALKPGDRFAVAQNGVLYVYAYNESAPKGKRLRQMASEVLTMSP